MIRRPTCSSTTNIGLRCPITDRPRLPWMLAVFGVLLLSQLLPASLLADDLGETVHVGQLPDGMRIERNLIEVEPISNPNERPWLDIRPREIGPGNGQLVSRTDLPSDDSGIPPLSDDVWAIQLPSTNLTYRDIAHGASHYHRPLYFEDRFLERYGSITCVLNRCPSVHAGFHFLFSTATFPISVMHYPPCRAIPTGHPSRWEADVAAAMMSKRVTRNVKRTLRKR